MDSRTSSCPIPVFLTICAALSPALSFVQVVAGPSFILQVCLEAQELHGACCLSFVLSGLLSF